MKKKIVSLLLTTLLCVLFVVPAFADDVQYKIGKYAEYSGHTDFGYYYTYTTDKGNYKCFSVVKDDQRIYASVKESLYEYSRAVFDNQDITFEGVVQQFADDGNPIIDVRWTILNEDGKKTETSLKENLAPVLYQEGTELDFKAFCDLYDDGTASVAEDGSYMTIDNNPYNARGGSILFGEFGLENVKLTNKALGLPDWLYEEMGQTRALDGRQKEVFDNVTVTWSYHPDQGLEVLYRKNH